MHVWNTSKCSTHIWSWVGESFVWRVQQIKERKGELERWSVGEKDREIKNIEKCGGASWIFHQRIIFCREDVRSPLVRAILRILSFRRTFSVELDLDELIWPRHLRELQKLDNSLVTLLSMWGFTRNYQILQAHYKDRLDQYSNIDY